MDRLYNIALSVIAAGNNRERLRVSRAEMIRALDVLISRATRIKNELLAEAGSALASGKNRDGGARTDLSDSDRDRRAPSSLTGRAGDGHKGFGRPRPNASLPSSAPLAPPMSRAAFAGAAATGAKASLLSSYRTLDGRPLGSVRWCELPSLIEAGGRYRRVLRRLYTSLIPNDENARISQIVTDAEFERIVKAETKNSRTTARDTGGKHATTAI